MSSVLLILSKCVTEIPLNGGRDVTCYLFCLTLILEIIEKDHRYVPEVIHSLLNLLKAGFYSNEKLMKTSFDLLKETDDCYFTFKIGSNIWHNIVCIGLCFVFTFAHVRFVCHFFIENVCVMPHSLS